MMKDADWERLIDKVREGNVIPIVGPRVMVGPDGSSLQAQVAMRLLKDCDKDPAAIALPAYGELNAAVSLLKDGMSRPSDLYDYVHSAIANVTRASDFATPEAIRQLAQIADFRLMVTLTPDDLLVRALRKRCAVNEVIHSPEIDVKDLPVDWDERTGEVYLLYLFGKSSPNPFTFAIHDEDVLEYAHNLVFQGQTILKRFLAQLQQHRLLLIGCNFPAWLSRFILRATARKRLSESSSRKWLIEPQAEESLTCFLNSYSPDIEILSDISPVDFVAELHRRWMNRQRGDSPATDSLPAEAVPSGTLFFISYSRANDLPRAEALYQALIKLGVSNNEVWFDRNAIEPGQDFQRRILDGIRGCRYFLPLVSRATDARREGFIFIEWDTANSRLQGANYDFLSPVIVDDDYQPESYSAPKARVWLDRHLDFAHAPGGIPDARLAARLTKLVRDYRSEEGRR